MAIKKLFIVTVVVFLLCATMADARQIAGVNLAESLMSGQDSLHLNGAGIRTKLFLKLYVGGLYLQRRSQEPEKIIRSDEPMAIRLHIISTMITSSKMEKATREGFVKATGGDLTPIRAAVEKFIAVFREKIGDNDVYDMIYVPGRGVEVYKNGQFRELVEGLAFKQALFGIWLCEQPAQQSLKEEMLGI